MSFDRVNVAKQYSLYFIMGMEMEKFKNVLILIPVFLIILAFVLGERSNCNSLGGEYLWDFGICRLPKE